MVGSEEEVSGEETAPEMSRSHQIGGCDDGVRNGSGSSSECVYQNIYLIFSVTLL